MGVSEVKVLVVRAEMGRVVESRVLEGEFYEVVKKYVSIASSEWDPEVSDFVVVRDDLNVDVEGSLEREVLEYLRSYGSLEESEGALRVRLPVYTISFDNRFVGEDSYVENKVYIIAPYVNEDLRVLFETEAASITTQEAAPEGIRRV
jgi:hypothetical protein